MESDGPLSDGSGHQGNYIPRPDGTRLYDGSVESAHAPTRRRRVTLFDALIIDVIFEPVAVDVELCAGSAGLGDFEHGATGPKLVAEADITKIDAADGEVFSESTVEERISGGGEGIDCFRGNQEYGFARSAVDLSVDVKITGEPKNVDRCLRNRTLGKSARRCIHLDNCAFHESSHLQLTSSEERDAAHARSY